MTDKYSIGDDVVVTLPGGTFWGTIKKILPHYAFGEDTRYEVSGKEFITICTARIMRKNGTLFW